MTTHGPGAAPGRPIGGRSIQQTVQLYGPMPEHYAAPIAWALLNILEAAHTQGIALHTVEPGGVLLSESNDVRLADPGLAPPPADIVEYTAPERFYGYPATPAGDLFALGATLWFATEGFSLYRRESPAATQHAILSEPTPLPSRAGRLTPLILGLLHKDPALRPTVAQARALLPQPPIPGSGYAMAGRPPKPAQRPPDPRRAAAAAALERASGPRAAVAVLALLLYSAAAVLPNLVLGPTVPAMDRDLHAAVAGVQWLTIASTLVAVAAMPLLGKLGDLLGKKAILAVCGIVAAFGSAICAIAADPIVAIVGHGLQGVALAGPFVAFGLVRDVMPRRFGPWGAVAIPAGIGLATAFGPLAGALLVEYLSWRAVFWFTLLVLVLCTVVILVAVPETAVRVPDPIGLLTAALLSAGAPLLVLYLDRDCAHRNSPTGLVEMPHPWAVTIIGARDCRWLPAGGCPRLRDDRVAGRSRRRG
ncbi:MFS transporter [Nocardia sp. alder85J]|uniref:MFS transporter n=1 Tax=Nocardia sp. alder85J TaxID=2862949 RepID=UPI00224DDF1D|nr:MFS transporter [Nocardia sp. alder85J]MCX4095395.1 MFS transporter [Nocardia sp. alder85J]